MIMIIIDESHSNAGTVLFMVVILPESVCFSMPLMRVHVCVCPCVCVCVCVCFACPCLHVCKVGGGGSPMPLNRETK